MWLVAPRYSVEFILTYAFTLVSLVWLAYNVSFLKDDKKNFPQNFAFGASAWSWFIIELVISGILIGFTFTGISNTPLTIGILVIQIILLAVFLLRGLVLMLGKRHIENVGEKAEVKVFDLRAMLVDIDALIERAPDFGDDATTVKKQLQEVHDAIRYSDPMSNEKLDSENNAIKDSIVELERAVNEKTASDIDRISVRILRQVKDRNNKAKLTK
jgi:hypothetical protein